MKNKLCQLDELRAKDRSVSCQKNNNECEDCGWYVDIKQLQLIKRRQRIIIHLNLKCNKGKIAVSDCCNAPFRYNMLIIDMPATMCSKCKEYCEIGFAKLYAGPQGPKFEKIDQSVILNV